MGKYSEQFDAATAAKAAADAKAKADKEAKEEAERANLEAGKEWLETVIIPELAAAKADLEGKVLIEHSSLESVQMRDGVRHSVFFTVNPWRSTNFRSFRFEIRTNASGWMETYSHRPDGQCHPERDFCGRLGKINMEGFDKLLGRLIEGIANLKP